ncbi:MAG TPA: hypothetical protein VNF71_14725 [Acidimicrobiales bacterium]|nr:hypothetical protein [Acidimicrobiales bacterium]
MDLYLPAEDADFFDDQAQEALALLEVELVEAVGDACGEVAYTAEELVMAGELLVAGLKLLSLGLETRVP